MFTCALPLLCVIKWKQLDAKERKFSLAFQLLFTREGAISFESSSNIERKDYERLSLRCQLLFQFS